MDRDQLHSELARLREENAELRGKLAVSAQYIRDKVNQLLTVMGTSHLKPEELDDSTLIETDPIGIVGNSFSQILRHLHSTNEKLKIANEEIKAIFDSAGMGILVINMDMEILAYNMKMQEQFIAGGGDATGRLCYRTICNFETPFGNCPFTDIFETGESRALPEWVLNDRYYSVVGSPILDEEGRVSRVVLVYMDITERRKIRELLASEKERLAVTLRSIGDGVITTDTQGHIVLINRQAEIMTGYKQAEAAGRPITEVFCLVDEITRARRDDPVASVLKSEMVEELPGNTMLVSRDGTEYVIADSAAPIMDRDSKIIGTVLVFRDITDKRKTEERILRAEKIESLGVLAGGIAHDFNNLLSAIMGNIEIAKISADPESEAFMTLARAEKAAMRAGDLTKQLLTFSKGGAPIKRAASVAELIKDSVDFAGRGASVKCETDLPDDLWKVELDEGQFSQVINNLVLNAVQAMPEGGVIRINACNSVITPALGLSLAPGRYVRITVKDEGAGIAREQLSRIFEPYYTTKQTGSGLGLATTYSIIKRHDGLIDVESEIGRGTTFFIYLPALTRQGGQEQFIVETRHGKAATGRILLMDDEDIIRAATSDILRHIGYEVECVADGVEALEAYRQALQDGKTFDAVIIDLTIPGGMGGKETIKRLIEMDPGVRAIVSSGYSGDALMSDYKSYGFMGVLAKPYRRKDIEDMLREVIS